MAKPLTPISSGDIQAQGTLNIRNMLDAFQGAERFLLWFDSVVTEENRAAGLLYVGPAGSTYGGGVGGIQVQAPPPGVTLISLTEEQLADLQAMADNIRSVINVFNADNEQSAAAIQALYPYMAFGR